MNPAFPGQANVSEPPTTTSAVPDNLPRVRSLESLYVEQKFPQLAAHFQSSGRQPVQMPAALQTPVQGALVPDLHQQQLASLQMPQMARTPSGMAVQQLALPQTPTGQFMWSGLHSPSLSPTLQRLLPAGASLLGPPLQPANMQPLQQQPTAMAQTPAQPWQVPQAATPVPQAQSQPQLQSLVQPLTQRPSSQSASGILSLLQLYGTQRQSNPNVPPSVLQALLQSSGAAELAQQPQLRPPAVQFQAPTASGGFPLQLMSMLESSRFQQAMPIASTPPLQPMAVRTPVAAVNPFAQSASSLKLQSMLGTGGPMAAWFGTPETPQLATPPAASMAKTESGSGFQQLVSTGSLVGSHMTSPSRQSSDVLYTQHSQQSYGAPLQPASSSIFSRFMPQAHSTQLPLGRASPSGIETDPQLFKALSSPVSLQRQTSQQAPAFVRHMSSPISVAGRGPWGPQVGQQAHPLNPASSGALTRAPSGSAAAAETLHDTFLAPSQRSSTPLPHLAAAASGRAESPKPKRRRKESRVPTPSRMRTPSPALPASPAPAAATASPAPSTQRPSSRMSAQRAQSIEQPPAVDTSGKAAAASPAVPEIEAATEDVDIKAEPDTDDTPGELQLGGGDDGDDQRPGLQPGVTSELGERLDLAEAIMEAILHDYGLLAGPQHVEIVEEDADAAMGDPEPLLSAGAAASGTVMPDPSAATPTTEAPPGMPQSPPDSNKKQRTS